MQIHHLLNEDLDSGGLGYGPRESAFLQGLEMLLLLVHGLHFELQGPTPVIFHQYQQLQHHLGTY